MIYDIFGNKCFKCGSKYDLCMDHHYPLSKGYGLSTTNAVLLCRSCNSSKHDRLPEDFYDKEELSLLDNIFIKLGEAK